MLRETMSRAQREEGEKACRIAFAAMQVAEAENTVRALADWETAVSAVRNLAAGTEDPPTAIRWWWMAIGPSGPYKAENGWHHRFEQTFGEEM